LRPGIAEGREAMKRSYMSTVTAADQPSPFLADDPVVVDAGGR